MYKRQSRDFAWSKVNTVGPIFDLKKLDWLNGQYIRDLELGDLTSRLVPFLQAEGVLGESPTIGELARLKSITEQIQTRMNLLSEAPALVRPFFVADDELEIAEDALAQVTKDVDQSRGVLDAAISALDGLHKPAGVLGNNIEQNQWHAPQIEAALREAIVDGMGIKPRFAFGPLRTAVSGQRISPPLFESMEILGQHSTLARLRALRSSLG